MKVGQAGARRRLVFLGLLAVIVPNLYIGLFAAYAIAHRVPANQLSVNFLRLHHGAIVYGDQHRAANRLAFLAFYPASAVLYHAAGIDAQVHLGDLFWYEFAQDDFID